jgi:hypothetical protein
VAGGPCCYLVILRTYSKLLRGNPYDNATAESFIKALKTKEIYLWEYWTLGDAKTGFPISSKKPIIANGRIPLSDTGCL